MSGLKIRHSLKNPLPNNKNGITKSSSKEGLWELWKDLCNFTRYQDTNVHNINNQRQVWASFNKMVTIMRFVSTTSEECQQFQHLLKEFTHAIVVTTWRKTNINH